MNTFKQFGLRFHHLGLASRREEEALKFLEGLGYSIGKRIHDPLQNVHLRFCQASSVPDVELVTPTDSSGPLDSILKTTDANFYHTCYETINLDISLQAIRSSGNRVICVSEPKPAVLFDGRPVSFYLIKGFGIIELLESNDVSAFA